MKLSIRSITLLMILVPTLLPALALSAWHTSLRVRDARAELHARGERESRYLADASALALLVADSETLQRLAASNLQGTGAAVATIFLDAEGRILAASGAAREVGRARECWLHHAVCAGGEQRYLFEREVLARSRSGRDEAGAFSDPAVRTAGTPELIGRVVLSFDPSGLAGIERAVLLNSALITLGALLLASVLAHLFSRRLTVPMHRLSLVVSRIRLGDLAARTVPAGSGELRELEEGVNSMADRVEAAAAEQNRRVDEATAELSHALIEREQRNRELDQALERAEAAGRAKDMFLARMSHELRTPLTTVTGYARLMRQSGSAEERAELYRQVELGARDLQALVDDILSFVKLGNGSLRLERREFDLESCIEDAVMMQAPAAHAKALALVCHVEPGLPQRVIGDSLRVSQVLGNLISNAIKFTPAGCVTVRGRAQRRDAATSVLMLEVIDTGIGIPAESVPQLFKPFVQADESMTRRFGGSGLGLSISSGLVEALDGSIELDSDEGRGTCVRVQLPFALAPADAHAEPAPLPRLRVALAGDAASPHLPVVRDYLGSCFDLVPATEPGCGGAEHAAELLVTVEDHGHPFVAAGQDVSVPLLRLRPVEVTTDPVQHHRADCLSLPLRRRELLAACARRAGGDDSVDGRGAPPAEPERARVDVHCMIVEDNELNRRMIGTQLRGMGARVTEAGSGREALAALGVAPPDLLLLDVHMPEMDGIALAASVRERFPALPVYALTANVIGSEEGALAAAGVRAVLYKPIDEAQLLAVLRRHERASADWDIVVPQGIAREEVARDLRRLLAVVTAALDRSDAATAAEAAHQMLGTARMFTRGALQELCLALEGALRDDGTAQAARATLHELARRLAGHFP